MTQTNVSKETEDLKALFEDMEYLISTIQELIDSMDMTVYEKNRYRAWRNNTAIAQKVLLKRAAWIDNKPMKKRLMKMLRTADEQKLSKINKTITGDEEA